MRGVDRKEWGKINVLEDIWEGKKYISRLGLESPNRK